MKYLHAMIRVHDLDATGRFLTDGLGLRETRRMESPQGRFTRSILLDEAVDIRQAEAQVEGGLLTITIPRVKDRRGTETVIPVRRDGEDS